MAWLDKYRKQRILNHERANSAGRLLIIYVNLPCNYCQNARKIRGKPSYSMRAVGVFMAAFKFFGLVPVELSRISSLSKLASWIPKYTIDPALYLYFTKLLMISSTYVILRIRITQISVC